MFHDIGYYRENSYTVVSGCYPITSGHWKNEQSDIFYHSWEWSFKEWFYPFGFRTGIYVS
jgi:hypothetical protein